MTDRGGIGRMPRSSFANAEAEAWTRAWTARVAARSVPGLEARFVETRFGATHLLRTPPVASGTEVLCLPQWGTPGAFWAVTGALAGLAAVARVTVADLPGHPGLSTGVALPLGRDGYAAWVEQVLDGLGVRDVHLMGSSLGGFVAVRAAGVLGPRVRSLVLCAPAGFVWPLLGPSELGALVRYRWRPTPETVDAFLGACLLGSVQPLAASARAELVEALRRFRSGFRSRARAPLRLSDRELSGLRADVLLILGSADPVFSPRGTAARARRRIAAPLRVEVLERHGHALELSERATSLAAGFLAERIGPARGAPGPER